MEVTKEYKHLYPALKLNFGPFGACFHQSLALVLDLPASKICVGTFKPANEEERRSTYNAATEPFLHAWVEHEGQVLAPTTVHLNGGLFPFGILEYYSANGITDVHRMDREQVLKLSKDTNLSGHLQRGEKLKGKKLVLELLTRMGVAFRVTGQGAVLPLNSGKASGNALFIR